MSQFNNRPIEAPTGRQILPAPSYYQPIAERDRWESTNTNNNNNNNLNNNTNNNNSSSNLPLFGSQGYSTYPSMSYPYHSSSSSREAYEYRQQHQPQQHYQPQNNGYNSEFHPTDRQLPNPYPSPTFSSPPLASEQQLGPIGGPSRLLPPLLPNHSGAPYERQLSQYNVPQPPRRSPPILSPVRHDPYRRPESQLREEHNEREKKLKEGPIRPFASKVSFLLKNPDKYSEAVRWDVTGTTFILSLTSPALFDMLKEMFGHVSIAAFCHQLNTYGFVRLTAAQLAHKFNFEPDPKLLKQYSAWTHTYFTRDDQTTLNRLTPKQSRAREEKRKEKAMRVLMI